MPHSTHGTVVLMGSGEMAASMVEVHRYAMSLVEGKVRAAFIDTPAGFQLNADLLAQKAVEYFEHHLSTPLQHIAFKNAGEASPEDLQQVVSALHEATYIFAGPGSPTYAVDNWHNTPVYDAMFETLTHGGCVTFASAAALTVGSHTIPVYEVYKVGGPVEWTRGLDIIGHSGLDVAVVPHWNNKSGGDHDTRYCFMGQPRWEALHAQLPPHTTVLGLDEHTACILHIDQNTAEVRGVGQVTILRGDEEHTFADGQTFSLDLLRPTPGEVQSVKQAFKSHNGPTTWAALQAKHDALIENDIPPLEQVTEYAYDLMRLLSESRQAGDTRTMQQAEEALREEVVGTLAVLSAPTVDKKEVIAPYIDLLLAVRADLRTAKQWDIADTIRDRLIELGIEVRDTADGADWELTED